MFFPYAADVSLERPPIANWLLIAITAAVSGLLIAAGDFGPFVLQREGGSAGGILLYAFAHGGVLHLAGNLWFLWLFGNGVNARLGHPGYVALYAGAAVVGGLAWLVFSAGTGMVGASAAIMGVAGAFLVLYPQNSIRAIWLGWRGCLTEEVRGFWLVFLYVAFDVLALVLDSSSQVAHVAHVGGFLAGAGAALLLVLTGVLGPREGERNLIDVFRNDAPVRLGPPAVETPIEFPTARSYGPRLRRGALRSRPFQWNPVVTLFSAGVFAVPVFVYVAPDVTGAATAETLLALFLAIVALLFVWLQWGDRI